MPLSLTLQAVEKRYDDGFAISPVSITVEGGAFASLLGPSGCGKSTLLRLIAGLERPDAGRIVLGERDITNDPAQARRVGMVFQNYALFPHLSVAENVAFGLKGDKAAVMRRVESMLELVCLSILATRKPDELSGGQQQRVAIARALAPQPDLLLLDEPLSALDAWSRASIGEELRAIQRRSGVTTLMVTHDRTEAMTLSDEVILMNAGALEAVGRPRDLYRSPSSEFCATFVGDMNIIEHADIRAGAPTGIRLNDILVGPATEARLKTPHTYVARIERVRFLGDRLRLNVLLNDFKTRLTADVPDLGETLPAEGELVAVTLPQERWRIW